MATGLVSWSQTASSNANADSNVNWAEGMSPSQVNDSARAVMASMAKWRDDNSGTLVSSGISSAYTVATNQVFPSLAAMDGQTISLKVHTVNLGNTSTLNVDGLGAKTITYEGTVAVNQGFLYTNALIELVYNNSLGVFIMRGDSISGFTIFPTGSILLNAPGNQYWIQCNGQPISRTTYLGLFTIIGTTYGAGDGLTTFNVPNIADLSSIHYYIHI